MNHFDANWYLQQYPDIAAAGVDPLQHYLKHGRFENRWPCELGALRLDQQLWQTDDTAPLLAQLHQLAGQNIPLHSALACWVLIRGYASFDSWQQAYPLIETMLAESTAIEVRANQTPFLLAFSTAIAMSEHPLAERILARTDWPDTADKQLAASMLLQGEAKLQKLSSMLQAAGLSGFANNSGDTLGTLLVNPVKPGLSRLWQPLVSVIVPCFNAEATIEYALNSLRQQSWQRLQIIVVDDASSDSSVEIVKRLAQQDRRIALHCQSENQGAYAVRNIGLGLARGRFITVHDSDDWSHPEKIARQVVALQQNKRAMASISHWVRSSTALAFGHWRPEQGWVYRNTSSLLYRRKAIKALGFWDNVSVGADTEYMLRLEQQYGPAAVLDVLPGVPLSFGLADSNSLTQRKATHLRTQFYGVRRDYREAAQRWHQSAGSLYLPQQCKQRPFAVPAIICRGSAQVRQHNRMQLIRQHQLFDKVWYLQQNPDVALAGADALSHFVLHGATEGRDPLPAFSLSGFACLQQVPLAQALDLWLSQSQPQTGPVWLKRSATKTHDAKTAAHLVLVAHAAGTVLFGAERSFIDVLKQLAQLDLQLSVIVPSGINPDYINQLLPFSQQLVVLPYTWWRADAQPDDASLQAFTALLKVLQPDLLYQNTSVLHVPVAAAKQLAIPSIMHVREVASSDSELCRLLHCSAAQLAQHCRDYASVIVANSAAVAQFVASPAQTVVLPNCLDETLAQLGAPMYEQPLRLGMISSNSAKKGLADFYAMAQAAKTQALALEFTLFGPMTEALALLQQQHPDLVRYGGYTDTPAQALAQLDAVLNLSTVAESFGRTVLEALATQRLVLAYSHGALADWLSPDFALLAAPGDWQQLLAQLINLLQQPKRLEQMAKQGADYAWSHYSPASGLAAWQQVISGLLNESTT